MYAVPRDWKKQKDDESPPRPRVEYNLMTWFQSIGDLCWVSDLQNYKPMDLKVGSNCYSSYQKVTYNYACPNIYLLLPLTKPQA